MIIFGKKVSGVDYETREGAYALIVNNEGKIGVVKTSTGFFLPGGGIEEGENHVACLERECLEETGHNVKRVLRYIGKAGKYFYSTTHDCDMFSLGYFYLVELKDSVSQPCEVDHEIVWLNIDEAISALWLDHQAWALKQLKNL